MKPDIPTSDMPTHQPQSRQIEWLHAAILSYTRPYAPALLSATLAVLLYAITLGGSYIFDDRGIVLNDERMHDVHKWPQLWTQAYYPGAIDHLYRPLISSSYAIGWWLHGDRPWIFHLVNVLIHALAAAAVAEFTRRVITQNVSLGSGSFNLDHEPPIVQAPNNRSANATATTAGLLFAAHPIHVEAVANIVGRAELASTAFIFATLILLCRPLTHARAVIIVAIGICAVLCKEQGILQPVLWLLLVALLFPKDPLFKEHRAALFRDAENQNDPVQVLQYRRRQSATNSPAKTFLLMTTWVWAFYLLLREHYLRFEWDRSFMDSTFQPLMLSVGWDRILMPVILLGHYIALLIWPAHLALDYGAEVIGHIAHANDHYLWIGFLVITLGLIATVRCLLTKTLASRFVLFCLLSFAITYGMIGNIVTLIGTNFAERLIYLPSAFFVMMLAVLLGKLPPFPRFCITAVIIVLASIRTVFAASNWNHPVDLYKASLAAQPYSIQAHLLLAQEYETEKNYPAAFAVLKDACDRYPNYWRVWQFRCEEAMAANDFTEADRSLKRAVELDHNPVTANLADRLAKAKAATRPQVER